MQDSPPTKKRPKRRPTAASIFHVYLFSGSTFRPAINDTAMQRSCAWCIRLYGLSDCLLNYICVISAKLAATRIRLHAMHACPATLSRICKSMCRALLSLFLRECPRHTMPCFASSPDFYREYAGHGCVMLCRFNPCLYGC